MLTLRSHRGVFAGFILASALWAAPHARAAFVGAGDNSVEFKATGPAGLQIVGVGTKLTAKEEAGTLKIVVPMDQFTTGIDLRDGHLRKALEAEKYPTATLSVARTSLQIPADGTEVEKAATGELSFHGQKKPFPFRYRAKTTGSDTHVTGLAEFNYTGFGMEAPCYLGVCVAETVKVKVKFKIRDE